MPNITRRTLLFSQAVVLMCEITFFTVLLSGQETGGPESAIVTLVCIRHLLHWIIATLLVSSKGNNSAAVSDVVRSNQSRVDLPGEIAEVLLLANGVAVFLMASLLIFTNLQTSPIDLTLLVVYSFEISIPLIYLFFYDKFVRNEQRRGTDNEVEVILRHQNNRLRPLSRHYRHTSPVRISMLHDQEDQPPSYESCLVWNNQQHELRR